MVNWGMSAKHLARSDARRKRRRVVQTSGPDDELRHCVVREQHGFAASTQQGFGCFVKIDTLLERVTVDCGLSG